MKITETPQLLLRQLAPQDVPLLFQYSQEPITQKELPDEVFATPEDCAQAVSELIANYENQAYPLVYGLVLKNQNRLIGHVSLSQIDDGVEIGYAMATAYQNQGYMREILPAFLAWIAQNLDLSKLYGIAKISNPASCHLLEQNGFKLVRKTQENCYFSGTAPVNIYQKTLSNEGQNHAPI